MVWTRRRWGQGLVLGSGVLWGGVALADAPIARLSFDLSPPQVGPNEVSYVEVELTLTEQPDSVQEPTLTAPKGVRSRLTSRSQSQMTRIINGKMSVELKLSFQFEVSAASPGKYAISAQTVVNAKKVRAPGSKVLTVTAQGKKSPVTKSGEAVMLVPHISPESELYVGQLAMYDLELWSRSRDVPSSVQRPKFQDFITEDFDAPRRRMINYQGYNYDVQSIYHRAIFPQKAGELEIAGIELELTPSAFGSLFGRTRSRRPYRVRGPDTKIKVLALPSKGRPKNFVESHVGTFSLRTEVDRSDLKQGDAFTLTIEVSGEGNLRLIDPGPLPEVAGLRSYDPKREDPQYQIEGQSVTGVVRWSYLLIASQAGTVQLPAMEMSYFDPFKKRYLKTKSSPITLDIKDADGKVPTQVAAQADDSNPAPSDPDTSTEPKVDSAEQMEFAPVVAGDRLEDRALSRVQWLTQTRYLGLAGAAGGAVALAVGQSKLSQVLGQKKRAAQKKQRAQYMGLLDQAKGADSAQAWSSLGNLLQKLAIARAGEGAQGLPRPELVTQLVSQGVSQADADAWKTWLDTCDASRFGAASQGDEERLKGCAFAKAQIDSVMEARAK